MRRSGNEGVNVSVFVAMMVWGDHWRNVEIIDQVHENK